MLDARTLAGSTALPASEKIQVGTLAYRKANLALFLGGFSTFWLLYWVQPLMPQFAQTYDISPAASSGALSVATGAMALMLLPASLISDRFGRKNIMTCAMLLAASLTLISAFVPSFSALLWLRGLTGIALAGLPAVAMAYLGEEIAPEALGKSMGIYIAGTALGGMSGRLVAAIVADYQPWHIAALADGLVGMAAAIVFSLSLPASRHFRPRPLPTSRLGRHALRKALVSVLKEPLLPALYLTGFFYMGCFVSFYNYLCFYLEGSPFLLSSTAIGFVFLIYVVGVIASARASYYAFRIGKSRTLIVMTLLLVTGLLLSLSSVLGLVLFGVACFTFAFFAGHVIASSWVGLRAGHAKALAASLYLSSYYLGSGVVGSLTGLSWSRSHWSGVVLTVLILLMVQLGITVYLRRTVLKNMPVPAVVVPAVVP